MARVHSTAPPLIEPVPVFDDFVSGIASIDAVGSCVRFVLYVDDLMSDGVAVRIIRRKLILPREQMRPLAVQARAFFGGSLHGLPGTH